MPHLHSLVGLAPHAKFEQCNGFGLCGEFVRAPHGIQDGLAVGPFVGVDEPDTVVHFASVGHPCDTVELAVDLLVPVENVDGDDLTNP